MTESRLSPWDRSTGTCRAVVALLFLFGPVPLVAQSARHPEPGFFLQIGGGVTMVEPYDRDGSRIRPSWGAGLGWAAARGPAVSAHLERVAYRIESLDADVAITYLALQPAWFVNQQPYTALYLGGRALYGWRHAVYRIGARPSGTRGGPGFGLVAGARSQASATFGVEVRAAGQFFWIGGGADRPFFHSQVHLAAILTP